MEAPHPPDTVTLPHLGRYQLLAKLGEGGMGHVYLAHDQRLDRRVAIKVLPEGRLNDPGAVARFQREAKALAQLAHPGIIQAHDSEEADGRHFLIMEYVDGQSLADLLKAKGRLAPAVAADYAHQAALALQHAHERGLIHRDVKPSNLLLAAGGRVKLLDLGLARFLQDQVADPARTCEGAGLGTPDYAAPEQFRDAHAADARADVYALGCTLFHLLTGQVPFPGSSFSEKYEAHTHKAPPPVEELCPDVPGGLALIVQKMLAKRPADRFQTGAEVAEALAPFVAGSSASFLSIRATSEWEGGRLTVKDWRARRRQLLPWAVAGLSLIVAVLAVTVGPRWFGAEREREGDQPVVENKGQDRPGAGPGAGKKEEKQPPAVRPEAPPDDPNVLTVSQKEEGRGKYRTISEALQKVNRGQTVRVLDDAVYPETLRINAPSRHTGITVEAARGATIETSTTGPMILIDGVPGVTLRGFRLHANGTRLEGGNLAILVGVKNGCPGLLLDRLLMEASRGGFYFGVQIVDQTDSGKNDAPLVVQDCLLRQPALGISLKGEEGDNLTPNPVSRIVLRDNAIEEAKQAIVISGVLRHVHVVGNRIWRAELSGLQLAHLLPGTTDILIANNTFFECSCSFRLWDSVARGERVQVRNNLFLASKMADMFFVDSGGKADGYKGPGDGKSVPSVWKLDHNCREPKPAVSNAFLPRAWIPRAAEDLGPGPAERVKRDTADLANFLRPEKGSDLATKGAGQTDPSLPSYIGALPPEGTEPWDWNRTWKAPLPGLLLTVSKETTGGGKFRTINEALNTPELMPWATIRVLDDATYAERVLLDDPEKHRGLCLDAPNHAVIELTGAPGGTLVIRDVPDVRVSGFRFREGKGAKERAPPVTVGGQTPGVVLENLDVQTTARVPGIFILKKAGSPDEEPVIVRRCSVQAGNEGIFLAGPVRPGQTPGGGIAIRDNRIWGAERGISLQGALIRVQLTGNLVWDCPGAALTLENLREDSERLLIANNTGFSSGSALRIWDLPPFPKHRAGQVEVCNNLLIGAAGEDAGFFLGSGESQEAGDSASLVRLWRFHHNWRDLSGQQSRMAVPLVGADRKLDEAGSKGLSRKPDAPDFLRPAGNSPLTTGGAGDRDPSLPSYVGAVPPQGTRPWDWDRTWRSRAGRETGEKERDKP